MRNLAVIPARSGSKGLPDKNIRLLNGKPLLSYSVEAAISSGIFDTVYVSTDSSKYAEIAVSCGAEVPFLRSDENSSDTASSWDVVREALNRYEEAGKHFDMITLLQPTTPLRTAEDIKEAYHLFRDKKARTIVSVCEVDHSPLWCNTLPEDQSMTQFIRMELVNRPRQKLDRYYRINGAIYMVDTRVLATGNQIYETDSYAYIMDRKKSVDIDDELDFIIAEAIARNKKPH